MKKTGLPAVKAGAVEVAASVNGQIMPPIMGAAAFVMAELLGISYFTVITHAFLPAVISYIALFYISHLESVKLNIKGLPESEIPPLGKTFLGGIHFLIPIFILVFIALKNIPINLYTTLLMTTPFFVIIFSKLLQNEKLNYLTWFSVFIGFIGVLLVIKPSANYFGILIIAPIIVAMFNGFNFIIIKKFSNQASYYAYTFYYMLPITIFSYFFFFNNFTMPTIAELIMFFSAGSFAMGSILLWTTAFHIAGNYSSTLGPFLFTQIIWAAIFGNILFSETLDLISLFGIVIIICSGTLAMYNNKSIYI